MKIVIAPNAFKESVSAIAAARAIRKGLELAWRRRPTDDAWELIELPIADGGDGTAEILRAGLGGTWIRTRVMGPMGEAVASRYLRLEGDHNDTAIVELSVASGLKCVPPARRNPLLATTYGTGELIRHALARGVRKIAVALGGSATVDGGSGIARALGFKLLDRRSRPIGLGGGPLRRLATIEPPANWEQLKAVEWVVLTDVRNPMLGVDGAATVFGPQKGATRAMVAQLEEGLRNLAECLRRDLGQSVTHLRGGGAAGATAAGLAGFLGARLLLGADWVLDRLSFENVIQGADLLLTGEGKLDRQSLYGKAPVTAARRAALMGVPTIGLAGVIDLSPNELSKAGMIAAFSLCAAPCSTDFAMAHGRLLLERLSSHIGMVLVVR